MLHRIGSIFLPLFVVSLSVGIAYAFSPNLTQSQVKAAIARGKQEAQSRKHGFEVKQYVLYGVRDPMKAPPGRGEVDAVIVGTPREMLMYRSYLANFQGQAFKLQKATRIARRLRDTIHFVVFAHAQSGLPKDQDFLSHFSHFEFKTGSGTVLRPAGHTVFGPSKDFFSVPGKGREFLWLGTDTVRFSLKGLVQQGVDVSDLSGVLSFDDASGHGYHFEVKLGSYD